MIPYQTPHFRIFLCLFVPWERSEWYRLTKLSCCWEPSLFEFFSTVPQSYSVFSKYIFGEIGMWIAQLFCIYSPWITTRGITTAPGLDGLFWASFVISSTSKPCSLSWNVFGYFQWRVSFFAFVHHENHLYDIHESAAVFFQAEAHFVFLACLESSSV